MKKILIGFMTLALLAGCNNDDDMLGIPIADGMTDTPVMVNAGVADLATRAGMTTNDLVDLGLHIKNEANNKYSFVNVKFEKDASSGEFLLADTDKPLWQNATQKINALAYSPYNAAWTDLYAKYDVEVKTDQTAEAGVKASDLLWAQAVVDPAAAAQPGDIRYNNGALDITLRHICSKLTVNVRFGSEWTGTKDVPAGCLTLNNLNVKGDILLESATVGGTSGAAEKIHAYKNGAAPSGYQASFEAIVLPQKSMFMVEMTLEGSRLFRWEHGSEFTFVPGRSYTLNLLIGKDKVTIDEGGISTHDWNHVDGGHIETE